MTRPSSLLPNHNMQDDDGDDDSFLADIDLDAIESGRSANAGAPAYNGGGQTYGRAPAAASGSNNACHSCGQVRRFIFYRRLGSETSAAI